MAEIESRFFGTVAYKPQEAIEFPLGLPAFEDARQFALLAPPSHAPLVFLQSLQDKDTCFVSIPVALIAPGYELTLDDEEVVILGEPEYQAGEFLQLAVVCLHGDSSATANLLAPIVINPRTRIAVQSVRCDRRYSHEHPLAPMEPVCS